MKQPAGSAARCSWSRPRLWLLGLIRGEVATVALTSRPRKVKARPGGARSDSNGSPSGPAAGRREAVPLRSEHVAYAEPSFRASFVAVLARACDAGLATSYRL